MAYWHFPWNFPPSKNNLNTVIWYDIYNMHIAVRDFVFPQQSADGGGCRQGAASQVCVSSGSAGWQKNTQTLRRREKPKCRCHVSSKVVLFTTESLSLLWYLQEKWLPGFWQKKLYYEYRERSISVDTFESFGCA